MGFHHRPTYSWSCIREAGLLGRHSPNDNLAQMGFLDSHVREYASSSSNSRHPFVLVL